MKAAINDIFGPKHIAYDSATALLALAVTSSAVVDGQLDVLYLVNLCTNIIQKNISVNAMLAHAKSAISHCTLSVITTQQASVNIDSTLLHRSTAVGY